MIDYYPFLLRAVQAADSTGEEARRAVYTRAWEIVTNELRARHPPISVDELRAHRSAIQSAMERIEHEHAAAERPRRRMRRSEPAIDIPRDMHPAGEEDGFPAPPRSRRALWAAVVVAVLVGAIGAGGYAAWTAWSGLSRKPSPPVVRQEEAAREPLLRRKHTVVELGADLAPGVDGGSTDTDLSLIFRRQRVFYRSTFPPGTIVVDKPQHFAYLVMPNSTALRYGIGVGTSCAELIGLRRVANKSEWPDWTPPPGSNLNRGQPLPGGPGNPLGARTIDLDDNSTRIHGTNAPKTIGEDVDRGCVRLVNDDVADLYKRVPVGTGVVLR